MQVFALIFVCAVATSMTEAHHFGAVSRKWELIFHARAGNGEKVMPAFYGTHSKCAAKAGVSCRIQDGCFQDAIDPSAVLLLKSEPKHHLRSSIIDHWVNANIKMVKVSLFKDGEEVAYIVFNAVGSTKDNWFHNTRILESSWCDVLTNGKYNIFSILGAENERTFNINNVHDGCPGESGWLFLSEGNVECSFDKQKKYPQFYYAQKGTVTRWNLKVSKKWELIFHARAGNGEKVMPAFYGTHAKCAAKAGVSCRIQDGCFQDAIDPSAVLLLKSEPKYHLRSRIIDYWVNANIKMVKVSLFKNGEEVAYIVFNAVGSTRDNWFHKTRILESSWCDVLTNGKYNIFSISGFHNERTFHINKVYNGCPGDFGWLLVSEGRVWCNFEKHKRYPQFLYAQKGTVTRWNLQDFGKADVFAIFIIRD